ncbi:unnamed protein product [Darwinula stevensoni]|uniref:Peptidase S1 domain-containing protein n=1 Tax=Darwinula stevensoni TaxID=69355 RepID=A0A7R9ACJ6_9CRUS|nr:unnamed protein product [Darwinula stevensoni]CAG0900435.1 unnamed protein product [Darwinula stevensoni]
MHHVRAGETDEDRDERGEDRGRPPLLHRVLPLVPGNSVHNRLRKRIVQGRKRNLKELLPEVKLGEEQGLRRKADNLSACGRIGAPPSRSSGIPRGLRRERSNGRMEVEYPGKYPWMVVLSLVQDLPTQCVGTLITDRHVLTSAHCFQSSTESLVVVTLGEHDMKTTSEATTTTQTVPWENVIRHPHFDASTPENDIALVRLDTPVNWEEFPNVRPVCLANTSPDPSAKAVVAWWEWRDVLLEAELEVLPDSTCSKKWPDPFIATTFCALGIDRTCHGVFEEPVMIQNEAGIFEQFGIPMKRTCREHEPGFYIKVAGFLRDFIQPNTQDAIWCPPE